MILSFSLIANEVTEGVVLSMETLIRKELCSRSSSSRPKGFLRVGWRERVYGFYWKGRVWGSSSSQHKDSKCSQIQGATSQSNYSRTSVWKDSFLCRTVHLSFINVQMHFTWKPLITYKLLAVMFLFWECLSNTKGKWFYQPLDIMSTSRMGHLFEGY